MTIQNVFVGARDGLTIPIFDKLGRMTCNARSSAGGDYLKRSASIVPSVAELKIAQQCGVTFAALMAAKRKRAFPGADDDDSGTRSKVLFPAPADAPVGDDDPDDEPVNLAAKPKMRVRFPKTITERRPDGLLRRRKADL